MARGGGPSGLWRARRSGTSVRRSTLSHPRRPDDHSPSLDARQRHRCARARHRPQRHRLRRRSGEELRQGPADRPQCRWHERGEERLVEGARLQGWSGSQRAPGPGRAPGCHRARRTAGPAGPAGSAGAAGPAGPAGTAGPAGAAGPAGRSALTNLTAGETVRGFVAGDFQSAGAAGDWRADASFPIPAANAGYSTFIDGVSAGETCTGTSAAPTAPVNTLCVYPVGAIYPVLALNSHSFGATNQFGFQVTWNPTGAGDTFFIANYAFTEG